MYLCMYVCCICVCICVCNYGCDILYNEGHTHVCPSFACMPFIRMYAIHSHVCPSFLLPTCIDMYACIYAYTCICISTQCITPIGA